VNINPVRALILAVVAVVGVLVIANGFGGTSTVAAEPGGASTQPAPTTSPTRQGGSSGQQGSSQNSSKPQKPDMTGVTVQIFNATTTSGLAGTWQTKLQKKISAQPAPNPVGNASPDQTTTTVFYVDKRDKALAEELQKKFFPDGDAKYQGKDGADLPDLTDATGTAPATISKDTQLIIVLGSDAAA
jgi:LytR cell envelope-related transcriptional attenuator